MNYSDGCVIQRYERRRRHIRVLLGVLVAIFLICVQRQANATDATLDWDAVTEFTDGKKITVDVTYNIYLDGVRINGNIKDTHFYVGGYVSTKGCFTIRAVVTGIESVDSGVLCKPSVPVIVNPSNIPKSPVAKSIK